MTLRPGGSLATYARTVTLLLALALTVLEGLNEWRAYNDQMALTRTAITNLARSLIQHVEDTIQEADSVLVALVDRVETTGIETQDLPALIQALREQQAHMPRVRHIYLFDQEGNLTASSQSEPPFHMSVSDRAYFAHHKTTDDHQPFVGPLIRSRADGQWAITISRRINTKTGAFAGLALITIDSSYFSHYYSEFDIGEKGSISLISQDGVLLSRFPWSEAIIGRNYSKTPFFLNILPHVTSGTYSYKAKFDKIARLSAYYKSRDYPLIVLAAVAREEAFADWRHGAIFRGVITLCLVSLGSFMGLHLARLIAAHSETQGELVAGELRFRALAENSNDIVGQCNLMGQIEYISPAALTLLGDYGDLLSVPLTELIEESDRPALIDMLAGLRDSLMDKATLAYRLLREDGSAVWVEGSFRRIRPASGRRGAIVFAMRDITSHRVREESLSRSANTDSLTGLANRRHFDDTLNREWRRKARSHQPLTLLLFDLDRFKQFNDTYGHQAGDHVLAAVAKAARSCTDRAGDLVARYGGEEFAVILPGTSATAAGLMGEKIRQAIRALALTHAGNPPDFIVTISVGGASVHWDHITDPAGIEELLARADKALYSAKHQGRDRVVLFPPAPPKPASSA